MAVYDFAQMPRVLQQYAEGTKIGIQNMQSKVAKTGLTILVNGTPVDTGRAAANWKVSLGAPSPVYDSAGPFSSPRATVTRGNAIIRQATLTGPTASVFISNNAPYIQRLNDGWSKKKPAGFINRAFDAMQRVAQSERVFKKK